MLSNQFVSSITLNLPTICKEGESREPFFVTSLSSPSCSLDSFLPHSDWFLFETFHFVWSAQQQTENLASLRTTAWSAILGGLCFKAEQLVGQNLRTNMLQATACGVGLIKLERWWRKKKDEQSGGSHFTML